MHPAGDPFPQGGIAGPLRPGEGEPLPLNGDAFPLGGKGGALPRDLGEDPLHNVGEPLLPAGRGEPLTQGGSGGGEPFPPLRGSGETGPLGGNCGLDALPLKCIE